MPHLGILLESWDEIICSENVITADNVITSKNALSSFQKVLMIKEECILSLSPHTLFCLLFLLTNREGAFCDFCSGTA
jgi:hypothetical protein